VWDDPAGDLLPAMQRMMAAPAGGEPALTTALFIDDIETKGPRYMENIQQGRTALVLAVCTAT
jgi:hypothetical protein